MRAQEHSDDLSAQLDFLYRLALRRDPTAAESDIIRNQYNRAFQRFSEDAARARDYLSAGLTDFAIDDDALAEFAALASTARIVMNSPDAYTRH